MPMNISKTLYTAKYCKDEKPGANCHYVQDCFASFNTQLLVCIHMDPGNIRGEPI